MDTMSSEFTKTNDDESVALMGETPYETLIEDIKSQFDEFKEYGYVMSDQTNYIDMMLNALDITEQIKKASLVEFELTEDTITRMRDGFEQLVMNLFDQIEIDLSQVEDPFELAYILYTNFMLCNQRQPFFNYILDVRLQMSGLESEFSIAYGWMMEGKPQMLYDICQNIFNDEKIWTQVEPYLKNTGYMEMMKWIEDGSMPEKVLYDIFLNVESRFDVLFTTYYQLQKQTISY